MAEFRSLLPPSATAAERAIERATSRAFGIDVPIASLWNPDTCPAALLPHLAWSLHITDSEGWRFAASEPARRKLLRDAIALHRKKGTPWSIKRILAVAGYGDYSTLTEGRPVRRYDGTLFCDGSEVYGTYSWAEFEVDVDLGETAGLDADTPARVRALIEEWKPASRHLTKLAWHCDIADTVPVDDRAQTAAAVAAQDLRPWRRYYDGVQRYNQGVMLTYDGGTTASGARSYTGWAADGATWLTGAPESDTTLSIRTADTDRVVRAALYDGLTPANGFTEYGAVAPVAVDSVMPIWGLRHVCYDGRYSYDAETLFDGAIRADGARSYLAGRVASGNEYFYLEAA